MSKLDTLISLLFDIINDYAFIASFNVINLSFFSLSFAFFLHFTVNIAQTYTQYSAEPVYSHFGFSELFVLVLKTLQAQYTHIQQDGFTYMALF